MGAFFIFKGQNIDMTKLSEVNRYYLYFSSALVILIISLLVEVDPLYIAAFLLPIFFAMLFAHPNVDNFKEYKISGSCQKCQDEVFGEKPK